jgi:hypothetical protein
MSTASRFSRISGPAALIISIISLLIGLGGASYAAVTVAKNSVGSAQLKNNAVTSAKVKDRSLMAKDFKAGQLPSGARGAKGDKGDQGLPGRSSGWAWIQGDGSVKLSGGTYPLTNSDVAKFGTGQYKITGPGWNTVDQPATATLLNAVGIVGYAPPHVVVGTLFVPAVVSTYDRAGTAADYAFFVTLP